MEPGFQYGGDCGRGGCSHRCALGEESHDEGSHVGENRVGDEVGSGPDPGPVGCVDGGGSGVVTVTHLRVSAGGLEICRVDGRGGLFRHGSGRIGRGRWNGILSGAGVGVVIVSVALCNGICGSKRTAEDLEALDGNRVARVACYKVASTVTRVAHCRCI